MIIGGLMVITLSFVVYDDVGSNWNLNSANTPNHILIFVSEGQLTYTVSSDEIHLEKGDLLYIPEGALRSGTNFANQPHQKFSAHFRLNGEDEKTSSSLFTHQTYKKINIRNFNYIKQRFSLLIQHWIGRSPSYNFICHGILLELIGLMELEFYERRLSPRKVEIVSQLKKYILKHYRTPIKIADLAAHVDRTPNYVTNIFKEVTGQSPIQYLHYLRVSTARDLITETDMSLIEIADHLGFCDQSYFSKVFKSIFGSTPLSYRKHLR